MPTSREGGAVWKYAFEAPRTSWYLADFDDRSWPSARGGFGKRAFPSFVVRKTWETDNIYLRTSFEVHRIPCKLSLLLFHDGKVEVVLNGITISRRSGYTTDYMRFDLDIDPKKLLLHGKNVLAVHCGKEGKAKAIDVGILGCY